jgi:hypothetical protein
MAMVAKNLAAFPHSVRQAFEAISLGRRLRHGGFAWRLESNEEVKSFV